MTIRGHDVQTDEQELVSRARKGDRSAFGVLYQRHVERVYSYVAFRVRDPAVAEDITQDVFLQALNGLRRFDWRGSVAPWLLSIARNAVIDYWRRMGRRRERAESWFMEHSEDEDGGPLERVESGSAASALAAAELAIDRRVLLAAAQELTELQQQVLALRFAAGLSIEETALAMGKSDGAVKNLQHHALRALRKVLLAGGYV